MVVILASNAHVVFPVYIGYLAKRHKCIKLANSMKFWTANLSAVQLL